MTFSLSHSLTHSIHIVHSVRLKRDEKKKNKNKKKLEIRIRVRAMSGEETWSMFYKCCAPVHRFVFKCMLMTINM
jgi:hypothetical protein